MTLDELKEQLEYQPTTGNFIRLKTFRTVKKGDIAGSITSPSKHPKQYIRIRVCNEAHYAQRLAFYYMKGYWPKEDIDHINQNSLDNRWENLREVTHQQNGQNQKRYINNSSGKTGVRQRSNGNWRSRIFVEGKHIDLGTYPSFLDAVAVRIKAEELYGFHENHGK